MSTTPVTPPVQSPGVSNIFTTIATYAAYAAAIVAQEKADIAAGEHTQAVLDGVNGIGAVLAQANPAWGADISAAVGLVNAFAPIFVSLFHKTPKS